MPASASRPTPKASADLTFDPAGIVAAVDRSLAVVELELDGTVVTANQNFLDVMGYALEGIQGQHHRLFCPPGHADSAEYAELWACLAAGESVQDVFHRVGQGGRDVWLQATYTPVMGPNGTPVRVVKLASDVTEATRRAAETSGKIAAMDRSQAVIELDLDGRVITANDNFLATMGYSLPEIRGQHHRMFCEPEHVQGREYAEFWERLAAGQFAAGEFRRVAKGGREVWPQATYNPILDAKGAPMKVVKFATDVTATKLEGAEIKARVDAVDRAQAVLHDGVTELERRRAKRQPA